MIHENAKSMRWILKAKFLELKNSEKKSDQMMGILPPPCFKEALETNQIIKLPEPDPSNLANDSLFQAIQSRESVRAYSTEPFTQKELSFLLWASQGIRKPSAKPHIFFRNVPSAGCRHAFESYIAIHKVEGLDTGFYHYLPQDHSLELISLDEHSEAKIIDAALGQGFAGHCAATFLWTCLPYRMEWRYDIESTKLILLDAGHLCQNLMLAALAINAGTCAIGAYDQEIADQTIAVDGENEFVIYMASAGKLQKA
ncbi:MAG TPA: SagB/ThcOx family dehydrogenase [Caldisericia bacterium]|nr:SagB/ThcOx family dehydrogenase [Caldisericia bacterium]